MLLSNKNTTDDNVLFLLRVVLSGSPPVPDKCQR